MMAIMLEQLQLQPGQRVLEIGAGTGYNAALMAHIVGETGHVVTVDIDEDIVEGARAHLAAAGFDRVEVLCADGVQGYPAGAPYDRIILTVNAGDIAPAWREQLTAAGRLLLPLSLKGPQISVAFEQVEDHLESISIRACGFVGIRGMLAEESSYVQLSTEPGLLYLRLGEPRAVDTNAIYQLLTGRRQDFPLPIKVTPLAVFYGLSFWLALQDPQYCTLVAHSPLAEGGLVPELIRTPGKITTLSTLGLLGEHALSVLMRDPALPPATDEVASALPFRLFIRSFGADNALAQRLQEQVIAWEAAGRPGERNLHIKAYPCDNKPTIQKHDITFSKKWTQFICRWR
jgi:protein-L-isoaspartate(D-aspartate) O-methyltransferase